MRRARAEHQLRSSEVTNITHSPGRSRASRFAWAFALLVGLTIVFARIWHAGFIWDDEAHLTQNPCIVGPLGLADIWTSARAVYYPLVLTTFWIVHKCAGLNPLPYHLLNLGWHAASALLLWRVLRQLGARGAWLGAAIWALHPVVVQSVAWITEMKNTESAFFYLLSTSLFLSARSSVRSFPPMVLALVSFVAAITSKPSTVMLPVILGLCLWWKYQRLSRRDIVRLLPFLAVSVAASSWTIWEQKYHAGALGAEWMQSPLQRLLISADAICFYLSKLVWPHPLIFIYPRWHLDLKDWVNYLPLLGLVSLAALLFIRRNRELRPVFFAFVYFVITLFPVLAFFDVYFFRYSFVSDHFQYLASMGPLALVGAALTRLSYPKRSNARLTRRLASPAAAGLLLTILSLLSWGQTAKYRNLITLYRDTLAQNPGCWMADYNLGLALKAQGDLDGAITHYRRALQTHPNYVEAHYNLGGALVLKGNYEEALSHYRSAIQLKPEDADSHNNYASALRQIGQAREAETQYREAITLQPAFLDARLNLASLLLRTGRAEEAVYHLSEASRTRPEMATTHTALGNALMKLGRMTEAETEFSRAISLAPDETSALNSFAWLLATAPDDSLRDGRKALGLAQRANNLRQGGDPVILHTLAAAYAEAGQFKEAIVTAQSAAQLAAQSGNQTLVTALHEELALYQLNLPYRQSR